MVMNQRDVRVERRLEALEEAVFGNKSEQPSGGPRTQAGTERRTPREDGRVNLNAADEKMIAQAIAGVGPKTASDIVAQREADGDFKSLEDVAKRVGGVSLEQLHQATAKITV